MLAWEFSFCKVSHVKHHTLHTAESAALAKAAFCSHSKGLPLLPCSQWEGSDLMLEQKLLGSVPRKTSLGPFWKMKPEVSWFHDFSLRALHETKKPVNMVSWYHDLSPSVDSSVSRNPKSERNRIRNFAVVDS